MCALGGSLAPRQELSQQQLAQLPNPYSLPQHEWSYATERCVRCGMTRLDLDRSRSQLRMVCIPTPAPTPAPTWHTPQLEEVPPHWTGGRVLDL